MPGCCSDTALGISAEVGLVSGNLPMTIAVSGSGTSRTVTINVDSAAFYLLEMWLIDDAADPDTESLTIPSETGATRFRRATLVTGIRAITIEHTGAAHTWYMAVSLGGKIGISTALAFT